MPCPASNLNRAVVWDQEGVWKYNLTLGSSRARIHRQICTLPLASRLLSLWRSETFPLSPLLFLMGIRLCLALTPTYGKAILLRAMLHPPSGVSWEHRSGAGHFTDINGHVRASITLCSTGPWVYFGYVWGGPLVHVKKAKLSPPPCLPWGLGASSYRCCQQQEHFPWLQRSLHCTEWSCFLLGKLKMGVSFPFVHCSTVARERALKKRTICCTNERRTQPLPAAWHCLGEVESWQMSPGSWQSMGGSKLSRD